jgi:F-box domain
MADAAVAGNESQTFTRGKAAKERAKDLRKAVDQRRMNREGQRQQKREERLKLQETAGLARGSARSSRAESDDGSDVATPKPARERSARSSLTMSDDASPPASMPDAIGLTRPSLVEAIPMDLCLHILSSLGALELSACACTCHKLESAIETDRLWGRLHDRVYGASRVPSVSGLEAEGMESTITAILSKANEVHGAGVTDPAAALRHRLLVSSRALERLRTARACPLPLPGMLALCLDGEMLVSAHQGQLLRLTHVATGRRLACRKLKHAPVCCHAANGYAAVADVTGAVHTFHADDGFATQLGAPLETAQFGGGALSVAVLAGREAVGGSAMLAVRRGQGVVTVHELPSPEAASPLRFPELRFALTLEGEDGAEEGGEAAHVHPSLATSACDPSALYTVSRGGAARIDVEAERVDERWCRARDSHGDGEPRGADEPRGAAQLLRSGRAAVERCEPACANPPPFRSGPSRACELFGWLEAACRGLGRQLRRVVGRASRGSPWAGSTAPASFCRRSPLRAAR